MARPQKIYSEEEKSAIKKAYRNVSNMKINIVLQFVYIVKFILNVKYYKFSERKYASDE